jgi:hypothetical protein
MAMVDSTVTVTTVSMVSLSLSGVRGNTEAMAMAAEAPQIPTAPPDSTPKDRLSPSRWAAKAPSAMVLIIPPSTVAIGMPPNSRI